MEYVYAALLVHKAGKKVDEESLARVLEAAGVKPDQGRVKAVVAALQGVNIDEALQKAAAAPVVAAAAPAPAQAKPEEKKKSAEEEKKAEEAAAAGLSALFG